MGLRLGQPLARAYPSWVPYGTTWALDGINRRGWRKAIGGIGERFEEAGLTTLLTVTGDNKRTYFDSSGVLQTAATNALRFDHSLTGVQLGILSDGARTNVVPWNRDLTNVAWTKTNVTAAKNQVGIDGVANSASSLTATANAGTCLQAITLSSSARAQSAFVKRLTGSGTVEMTMNGGSTWTAITPTSSWARFTIPTATLANPSVGFRIATSGDAIAVDFVQNENGIMPSSPIATTTVAVTRAADVLTAALGDWFNPNEGTFVCEYSCEYAGAVDREAFRVDDNSDSNRLMYRAVDSGGFARLYVIAAGVVTAELIALNSPNIGPVNKVALAYKANDFGLSFNGVAATPDTNGAVPTGLTALKLGLNGLFGHTRELYYLPKRVGGAELLARSV